MDRADAERSYEPVAIADRSHRDESVHFGAAVALAADGSRALTIGDPDLMIYPRSALKPLQADAMLRSGLELDDEALALACASHDGSSMHVAIARRILASADLTDGALRNTADLPLDRPSAESLLAAGGGREVIYMNCSGKHAAMVVTCVRNGWSVEDYLNPDHPLQLAITARVRDLAGDVDHVGIDGCGAPTHVVPLAGLARALRSLARDSGRVWRAMTEHPAVVGGDSRDVTRLMRAVPGLMAKDGAEGVFAAALPDGRAAAVKISDGAARAAGIVLAAVLHAVDIDVPDDAVGTPQLGHGHSVGRVRDIIGRP